jgi:hypothetical protein
VKKQKRPPGRPSLYTEKLADEICRRLAEGESLRAICREDGMPGVRTVFDWLEADESFRTKYARAREVQAELMADELLEIADDGQNDWMEKFYKDGEAAGWAENGEALRRSQLRVATRQWIAAKLLPKKYGDKTQVEHSGNLTLEQALAQSYEVKGDGGGT